MTVGVLYDPWPARREARVRRYRTMVEFKANPRDEAYMRALFAERYTDGRLGGPADVSGAQRVVLLYPDAIGVGWGPVERAVIRRAGPGAEVRVLNGRRRDFVLDRRARLGLGLRRLLETALIGEAAASVTFVLVTPVLLARDLLGGRR
jgi:GNAT superfamily N-acetyltransferase